jgi:hypothetical protein
MQGLAALDGLDTDHGRQLPRGGPAGHIRHRAAHADRDFIDRVESNG